MGSEVLRGFRHFGSFPSESIHSQLKSNCCFVHYVLDVSSTCNSSISVLLTLLGRCFFFHLHIFCGYLNLLVATLSMTKCEMKPVKPAAGDTARQKLQPREECLSDATFGSKNTDVQNACER